MSEDSGLYSVVTDGTYIFVSNAYRNSIARIRPDGTIDKNYIIVSNPLSIAVRTDVLFVQTLKLIHLYDISVPYQVTNKSVLRFDSSSIYPSMVYNPYDNLLYISNYEKGTITSMNSLGIFTTILNGVVGVSGLCIATKLLYFSNEKRGTLSFYANNSIQECLSISNPRGICNSPNGIYICYGTESNYGIGLYKPSMSVFTNAIKIQLNREIPLTVAFSNGNFYYTSYQRNEIYKNGEPYIVLDYTVTSTPITKITQSALLKNLNCVNNPAFAGLINLRTLGTNQTFPITSLSGRSQGSQVKISPGTGLSYDVLKMRRKAEVLQYKNVESNSGIVLTKKQLLSNVVNTGGSYHFSKAKITQLINEQNCKVGLDKGIPLEKSRPSNSGISDNEFEGYYLNTYIPYYPSI